MSDESVLESIKTSQYGRFYYWKVKQLPIPRREIEQCSANTHIIPAGKDVESSLRKIRRGDIVHIQGMLVNVKAEKWSWKTSQTRNDTGGGACEIIWVDSLEIITDQIN